MRKRPWDAKPTAMLVIAGLKGKPGAESCPEPQIRQSRSSQGRKQLLAHAPNAFEGPQHTRKEARREQDNTRLKQLVGELLWEFKNSDEGLG